MRVKHCPVSIKAAGDHEGTESGVFEAIVAAYNVDSGGDRIVPGAFADTLAEWKSSGDPIPVYWSHRMDDPDYNIGHVLEAKETEQGLWVKAQMDMDGPKAQQVYRLLKGRRVKMFSFSYDITEAQPVTNDDGDEELELRKLKLFEVGPTPIGMNQQTDLLAVKALEVAMNSVAAAAKTADEPVPPAEEPTPAAVAEKTDDQPSAVEERAAELVRAAQALLDSLRGDSGKNDDSTQKTDDDKATPIVEPAAPSPGQAKGDEPVRPPGTASDRLDTDLALLELEVETL